MSGWCSNIGGAMVASEAYRTSRVHRKRNEEVFGWVKTAARHCKTQRLHEQGGNSAAGWCL